MILTIVWKEVTLATGIEAVKIKILPGQIFGWKMKTNPFEQCKL